MEDILFFIIIIIITPFGDVVPPIRDVIDAFGHAKCWGKTFVISQVSSIHKSIESSKESQPWKQGEIGFIGLLGLSID